MKVNFEKRIAGIDGEDIFETVKKKKGNEEIEEKVFMTLKTVCINSLTGAFRNEDIDGVEKMKRGELARKIYNSKGEFHINVDETTLVRDLIGKAYGVPVVLSAYDILDPKEMKVVKGGKDEKK